VRARAIDGRRYLDTRSTRRNFRGVVHVWQPRSKARHGLQPNSAGAGNDDWLAPIFFTGLEVPGDNAPRRHHPNSFCAQPASALRTGFSHLVVQDLSPYGQLPADRRGRTERRYNQDRLKNARVTGSGTRHRAHGTARC